MRRYDYLIIGGGIAGVTAAETIREQDPIGSIGIFSDEPHMLYSRVLLPSYLKKKIPREKVFLRTQRDFEERRIEFHANAEVVSVDSSKKNAALADGCALSYKKLLIASGGKAKPWENQKWQTCVYRLQTLDDADRLFHALPGVRRPLAVGGSFITLEFLEIFALNGIAPRLLLRDPHFFWPLIEKQGAELLHENFKKHGVDAECNDAIADISQKKEAMRIMTQKQKTLVCDSIALGIGLDRNREFLQESGIELGGAGVLTNEFFETNQEDIYAAGDIAEFFDVITGAHRCVGNWTNAFLQGKHAGLNMAGQRNPFKNVSSYSITNFGFQISAVGDCDYADKTIVRVNHEKNEYERLFLRKNALTGAFLINRFHERKRLIKLIGEQKPFA